MLPSAAPDLTTKATETQVLQALASLAGLPSRQQADLELARDMYFVALEGVTRYALGEAVKSIIRGGLGHTFFPSPVELRQQCDKAVAPHLEAERRVRQREQQMRENAEIAASHAARTPESIARAKAIYDRFCEQYEASKPGHKPFETTLDPDLVAKIPDADTGTFSKARVA